MLSKLARTSHLKRASLLQQKMANFSNEIASRDGKSSRPVRYS